MTDALSQIHVICRGWNEYEEGFGDLNGNIWLGLANIYRLTATEPLELHVYLEAFTGSWFYASFSEFSISDRNDYYRLQLSGSYTGTAPEYSLTYHNGMRFSTFDRENDAHPFGNCAILTSGAWWYNYCHNTNLNGMYLSWEIAMESYGTIFHIMIKFVQRLERLL